MYRKNWELLISLSLEDVRRWSRFHSWKKKILRRRRSCFEIRFRCYVRLLQNIFFLFSFVDYAPTVWKKKKMESKNIGYWTNEIRFPIKGISRIDGTEFSNINISLFTTCAFYRRFLLYSLIFLRRKMNDEERERNTHIYTQCWPFQVPFASMEIRISSFIVENRSQIWTRFCDLIKRPFIPRTIIGGSLEVSGTRISFCPLLSSTRFH